MTQALTQYSREQGNHNDSVQQPSFCHKSNCFAAKTTPETQNRDEDRLINHDTVIL